MNQQELQAAKLGSASPPRSRNWIVRSDRQQDDRQLAPVRIVALIVHALERARLQSAIRPPMSLTFVATVTELRKHFLLTVPRLTILLAEPVDAHGEATAPVLRQIKGAHPWSPLVIYCDAARHSSREIIELATVGVHELIFRGTSDAPTLVRAALESAARSCGAEVVLSRVERFLTLEARPIVEYCLYHPTRATGVAAVAQGLGLHRKTLVNRCARAGLPMPGFLIGWSRLLLFAHMARTRGGPVDDLALLLGFPSGTALRNMLKRYTALRTSDVHGLSGFDRLVTAFENALAASAALSPQAIRHSAGVPAMTGH